MNQNQAAEMTMMVINHNLQTAREYRQMAKEYMKKADEIEGMTLKVALEVGQRGASADDIETVKEATKAAKDVFENFGDLFSGKKGSK